MPDRQGVGIGAALVAAALEEARRRDEAAVVLLGSPAYYGRLGFQPAATFGLSEPVRGCARGGFEIEEEDFQVAVLDDERTATARGRGALAPGLRLKLPRGGVSMGPQRADVAQLVEHHLAKVGVAGSNPVVRSDRRPPSGGRQCVVA